METAGINIPLPGEGSGGSPTAPDEQPRGRCTSRRRAGPSLTIGNRADLRTPFSLPGEGQCPEASTMRTGASGFPGKFSGRSSDLDGQPKHLADALHFPGKDHSPSSETRFHIAPVSPAQLRHRPVPALARPFRLLTLQQREGDRPGNPRGPPPRAPPAPDGHRPTAPAPAGSTGPCSDPPLTGRPRTGAA